MPSLGDRLKGIKNQITGQPPPPDELSLPQSLLRQVDEASTLSWKQRAIGFAVCFGVGILLSFLSLTFLWTLQLTKFAVLYTFGNICSICSTMFLMGPCKQMRRMMEQGRLIATLVYIFSIVITLVVAFKTGSIGLVVLCLVIQTIALIWYCFTWIPGGQNFLKAMLFRG